MSETQEPKKPFDLFELLTALLLGLGAIGAAVAGHQNNLWGGMQSEAYTQATNMTVKASSLYGEEIADINLDFAVDLAAKKEIFEALEEEGSYRERKLEIASNLYTRYLSNDAYDDLGLPDDLMVEDEVKGKEEEYHEAKVIDEDMLIESLESELSDKYIDGMLAEAHAEFDKADKRFVEGGIANTNGDQFSVVQVIYTISLLFAGLGLVFKTDIRWKFWGAGTVIFVLATIRMILIPWA